MTMMGLVTTNVRSVDILVMIGTLCVSKTLWLVIVFLLVIGGVWWIIDSRLYDREMELEHIIETGRNYEDIDYRF